MRVQVVHEDSPVDRVTGLQVDTHLRRCLGRADRQASSPNSMRETWRISTLRTLPVTVSGEVVDELHIARDLVVRGSRVQKARTDSAVKGSAPLMHADPRAQLAILHIGNADDLGVDDVGVGVEEFLDLPRIDVLATADDHVLIGR